MGKGGSPAPQPTATSQTTIPEYAKPYVERMLGKAEAASSTPYQTYGGQRLATATPEQQAARAGVAGLQAPGQYGAATGLTAAGGLSSLGAGQTYMGMATDPYAQQAFMSPYMQNVVDVQQREAIRAAKQGQLGANLAAARQGTYGGARQLLAQTERERNLQDQMAKIQASGLQSAYEQAQKSMQFGTQAGLTGAAQAAQAGTSLGQLGTQQQAADLQRLQAQEQFGGLGQREQQAALDMAYQDFIRQQQYPYAQLGFMSDILRGSANLAQTGSRALYEAPPSMGAQLLGLAGTAAGAYLGGGGKFFAEGGEVKGLSGVKEYADGGEVGDVIKDMADVDKLTPDQIRGLQQSKARKDIPDFVLLAELDKKLAQIESAKAQGGLPQTTVAEDIRAKAMQEARETAPAGLDSIQLPDDYYRSEDQVAQMAGGGIVAFANEGFVDPVFTSPDFEGVTPDRSPVPYEDFTKELTLPELQEYYRSGKVPDRMKGKEPAGWGSRGAPLVGTDRPITSKKTPEAAKPAEAPAKPAPKKDVGISDKTVKKVEKAEDAYEKSLREELDKTNMSEDDKMRALGFALMKFGAKAMKARRGKEFEAYGEGIEAAADDYVKTLQTAKKDRRDLTKTLAEYGLAKEGLAVKREQVAATERGTAATLGLRQSLQQDALREKYHSDWAKKYANVPEFLKDGRPNPQYLKFEEWLKKSNISLGGGMPESSIATPGQRGNIMDALRS